MKKAKYILLVFIFMFSCVLGAYFSVNRENMKSSKMDKDVEINTILQDELRNIFALNDLLIEE